MFQVEVREYDLPDSCLYEEKPDNISVKVWFPKETCIVLGRSNNADDSLIQENIIKDGIPVYKRPSGGETVILSKNTLIISIAIYQQQFKGGKKYFSTINNAIIDVLKKFNVNNLKFKGISDITIGEMKILGSALYQNKNTVFYHAVLNIAESPDLFSKYLKHPQREPDYRVGRTHTEFVTSLKRENYQIDIQKLIVAFEQHLHKLQIKF